MRTLRGPTRILDIVSGHTKVMPGRGRDRTTPGRKQAVSSATPADNPSRPKPTHRNPSPTHTGRPGQRLHRLFAGTLAT